jgi:hypothetical protein
VKLGAPEIVIILAGIAALGWFALGQRRFLRAWLSWTAFCLLLYVTLLVTRGEPTPSNLVVAGALSPLVGLVGWLRKPPRPARDA